MLHKSKSKKINQLKYLLVFPSIVLFLIGCNSEVIANESEKEQQLKINPITKTGYRISAMEDDQQPLFVLNGKIISAEEMSAIIPDSIRSMTVIKNKNAIVKYGDKAKNVAIEIDNVKVVGNVANSDTIKINSNYIETHTAETNTIRIQGNHLFNLANPLIIVDGKEMLDKNTKDIDPDNVQSISVLKKETATKKYGDKGKNGVIEITSKK